MFFQSFNLGNQRVIKVGRDLQDIHSNHEPNINIIAPKLDLQVPQRQDFHPFFTLIPSSKRNLLCSVFIFTVLKNFGHLSQMQLQGSQPLGDFLFQYSWEAWGAPGIFHVPNVHIAEQPPSLYPCTNLGRGKKRGNLPTTVSSFCVKSWFWWHPDRRGSSFVLSHHQISFSFEIRELGNYFPRFTSGTHQGECQGITMGHLSRNRPKINYGTGWSLKHRNDGIRWSLKHIRWSLKHKKRDSKTHIQIELGGF